MAAKAYRSKKRRETPFWRKKAFRRAKNTTLAVLAALCALIAFGISAWGGNGVIPTWEQLYQAGDVSNAGPVQAGSGAAAEPTQLHFIDVGQGDAVLIKQSGEYALIDCGTEACEDALLAYLEQQGVTKLKLLVMTHPHADHIGSMDAVLENIAVEQFWLPELEKAAEYPTSGAFERVINAADTRSVPTAEAQPGDTCTIGDGTLTVLGTGVAGDNYNNISLSLLFTAGDFRFLDTGDGEKEVEQALLDSGADLSATVFKAAHHGSRTSNTLAFLQAVRPQIVAISCGLNNDYGHPHAQALENYEAAGAAVYRTDMQGSIVVGYAPETGVCVYTEREQEAAA